MNYNESRETTINLKELCVFILRRWRRILLVLILSACILAGYRITRRSIPSVTENQQETLTATENAFTANRNQIVLKEEQIKAKNNEISRLSSVLPAWEQELETFQEWLENAVTMEDKVQIASQVIILNDNILSAQRDIDSAQINILVYNEEIHNLEIENDELQETIETLQKELADSQSNTSITASNIKSILKYAILGAILGLFMILIILFLQYFFNRKLLGINELKERYGLHILGQLSTIKTDRPNPVDRILDRLAEDTPDIDIEKQFALIAAGIIVLCKKTQPKQQIMITGTIPYEEIGKICGHLEKYLPTDIFLLNAAPNPLYNEDAFVQITNCNIIIVEERGKSKRKEIEKLIELFSTNSAIVFGAIVK